MNRLRISDLMILAGTLALLAIILWVEGREWLARKRAERLVKLYRRK